MNARDEIIDWLRDAYAMERGLEVSLKKISSRGKYPEVVRFAAEKHLDETRQHAENVETLLQTLGADTSTLKTGVSALTTALTGISTMMSHDELLKDLIINYAAEHFEIASYRALIAGAETAGLSHVAEACRRILTSEEQMAAVISQVLPEIAQDYSGEGQINKAA